MNARLRPEPEFRAMTVADLGAVLHIEEAAYAFPWTRGNFLDSLAAGYRCELRFDADGALAGYSVAMPAPDEMHLLNLSVAPALQGRGHARALLAQLLAQARAQRLHSLWLEVRPSNERARALYRRLGFAEVGRRRDYYPAPGGTREDALVMSLPIPPAPEPDGLD
jgi:[ribosomal protein S18]-alanine N-acetyltransferase